MEVRIVVGRFVLQVGGPHGTRADPGAQVVAEPRDSLTEAFVAPPEDRTRAAATAASDLVSGADEVTSAIERANDLAGAIAKGLTLDPRALRTQLDGLLDVFDRADREGRFDDEIRLARSLVTLLGLVGRWIALLEVLRRTASAAAAVGQRAAEAWANHELGTFALAADRGQLAGQHLNVALAERNALGDEEGAEVTLHNLRLAQAIPLQPLRDDEEKGFLRRHAVLVGVVVALLLAIGGGAVAYAISRDGDEPAQSTEATTATSTAATTTAATTTTEPPDKDPPTVTISAPPLASGDVDLTAEAEDDTGVASVVFAVRHDGAADDSTVATVDSAPYATTWDTTAFADGRYTVRATASDEAGNNASATAQTTVDNTPPTVTIEDASDLLFAGDTGTASGDADDGSGSGIASVVIRYRPAGPNSATDAPWEEWPGQTVNVDDGARTYQAELPTDDVALGTYEIEALATDEAGNSAESNSRQLRLTRVD